MTTPSARALAESVHRGDRTATATVEAALTASHRAEATNALIEIFADSARARAAHLDNLPDNERARLPLAGVPVAIKDNFLYRDHRASCASNILDGFVAPYSATAVERLLAAGAIPIGRTNMDEFGMGSSSERSIFGPVRNPHDLSRSAGGSSGGSAAVVASDVVPLALGSDTGGSVRQPASFCGVTGFKPTWGRISRHGLVAFASSLDTVGVFGSCADDIALALEAIEGPDGRDGTCTTMSETGSEPRNTIRLGVPAWTSRAMAGIDEAVERVVRTTIRELSEQGVAEQREVDVPTLDLAVSAYYVCCTAEASTNLARFDGVRYGNRRGDGNLDQLYRQTRTEGFGPEVQRRILLGTYCLRRGALDAWYLRAARLRTVLSQVLDRALAECDVLALPTSPTTAFELGSRTEDPMAMIAADTLTTPASLAGLPAVSIPCGVVDSLPVGLQLIGRRGTDKRLLQVAAQLQASLEPRPLAPDRGASQ